MARAFEKKRRLIREAAKQLAQQLRTEAPTASPTKIRNAALSLCGAAYHRLADKQNG